MEITPDSVVGGIESAFIARLEKHPAPADILEAAIFAAFTRWLDTHAGEIVELIARALAKTGAAYQRTNGDTRTFTNQCEP